VTAPSFRRARRDDVAAIVAMLAEDALNPPAEQPGDPLPDAYWRAFDAIEQDPRQLLVVAEIDGQVVGTLQLSFIPYLVNVGGERAQIEAVRVERAHRDAGIGRAMIGWAVDVARARGCRTVQLTTDKRRHDAQRFYASMGFSATHEGMKLPLVAPEQPA